MTNFKKTKPENLRGNAIKLIGTDWMLITAKNYDQVNTMTAAWGGLGIMWEKPCVFIAIRPQRYTNEFVSKSDTFSLTFFDSNYKKTLEYLGSVSGRDENKIEKSGLTLAYHLDTPYFSEADQVLICRKLSCQAIDPSGFIDQSIDQIYKEKDYHKFYIAEIIETLQR